MIMINMIIAVVIPEKIAQILDALRAIRNEFAHNLDPITFNTPEIVLLCKPCFDVYSFRRFKAEVDPEVGETPGLTDLVDAFGTMGNVPNTPRHAYLNTVKAMLLIMELTKASFEIEENHHLEIITGKLS